MCLTEEQALALGRKIKINERLSRELPEGDVGACSVNSLRRVIQGLGDRYCLGYAAGSMQTYQPHAWIKRGQDYLECSPQEGGGLHYVLVMELTVDEISQEAKMRSIEGDFIPPLLDDRGEIFFPTPDFD